MRGMKQVMLGVVATVGVWGCGESKPKGPAPASATSGASAGSQAPATRAATPQSAPPVTSLDALLVAAKDCVKDGHVRRACSAYVNLRRAVLARKGDPHWRGALLLRAKGDAATPETRMALTLISDGALAGASDEMVPVLLPMLEAEAALARAAALRALGRHGSDEAATKALALLKSDTAASVREAAAWLLGRAVYVKHAEASNPALLAALVNDTDVGVRRATIGSLGALKPPKAVGLLVSLIDDPQLGPNAAVQLGGFEQPEAYRAILSAIAKAKTGATLSPSLIAAVGRMRSKNKGFKTDEVVAVLRDVRPFLEKSADATNRMSLRMVDRQLKVLAPAPASADPASAAPGSTP